MEGARGGMRGGEVTMRHIKPPIVDTRDLPVLVDENKPEGKKSMREIQGWMGQESLKWLANKAKTMRSIVEVGSWKGRSTQTLLENCPGTVFAVDHFLGSEDERTSTHKEATERDIFLEFWENVGHYKNLVAMRMSSVKAASFFRPGSVDMVFIDGCHNKENVQADLIAWVSIAKVLVCGHDLGQIQGAAKEIGYTLRDDGGGIWVL
jgi:predicted O-methyltransferase YrrM